MMNLTLTRAPSTAHGTFGILTLEGRPLCVTCEDPWKNNRRNESCIPTGTYQCRNHNGKKYTNVWEVTNVPGRKAILIHAGNTTDDTEGCILVGESFDELDGKPAVLRSRVALMKLRGLLPDNFSLTIE